MSEETQKAYPLSWPEGWPRTKFRRSSNFVRAGNYAARKHSMDESVSFVSAELDRLRAGKVVISTNIKLRADGLPYSGLAQPQDPGAAVYFELSVRAPNGPAGERPAKRAVSLACDKWNRVEDNLWAIGKHIESLRGQERWGVGSIDQAFRGYMALPAVGESSGSAWWQTLGVAINAEPDQVRDAYRILVKKHHPDRGGDAELFHRVQKAMEAFEFALRERERELAGAH